MDLQVDNHYEPNSTPKLYLSKLPCKPRYQPIQMLTPPLHPSVSIPFRWEEAPGKPRATTEEAAPPFTATTTPPPSKNTADPSRKITMMSSPAVVLEGPYMGRSLSLACTFSFRKGPVPGRVEGLRPGKKSSARMLEDEKKLGRGSSDFSPSLGDFLRIEKKNVKITRVRRRRRGFNLSSMNSNLANICASFKQAVPWICR